MNSTCRRLALLFAGLALLFGSAGCSGSAENRDGFDPNVNPIKDVGVSYKLRAKLTGRRRFSTDVAISPNGQLAVSAGDPALHVWSIPEARLLREIQAVPLGDNRDRVGTGRVTFFPDGKHVATVLHGGLNSKSLRFFQVETGVEVPHRITANNRSHLAIAKDGSKIAIAGEDGVDVWSLKDFKRLNEFRNRDMLIGLGLAVAFSPDGIYVAGGFTHGDPDGGSGIPGDRSPALRVWKLPAGNEVLQGWAEEGNCDAVAFSPNSRLVAAGGTSYNRPNEFGNHGLVQIWEITSQRLLHTLKADKFMVFSVAFHPSGRVLATGGDDQAVKLWDVKTGKLIRKLESHTGQVRGLVFSKDGAILLSAGDDLRVLVWEAD